MAKKKKKKKKNAERRRKQRASSRREKQRRKRAEDGGTGSTPPTPPAVSGHRLLRIAGDAPERSLAPVHIDRTGAVVPDPRAELGLPLDGVLGEATVRAAYRARLIECPPEQDPERARRAREARDRLLDPEAALEDALGVLHVPDAAAWGLQASDSPTDQRLPASARLLGQSVLYAMLEDALLAETDAR